MLASCTRLFEDEATESATSTIDPRSGDAAPSGLLRVSGRVVLRSDRRVAGVLIEPGGELVFHPGRDVTLRSTRNIVVLGRLTMKPRGPKVQHKIVFANVNESGFEGGGMDVLDSDVGLWVMQNGVLDIAGEEKLAWTRTTGSVEANAETIELSADPAGWRVGDELVITPTGSPSTGGHSTAFDVTTVQAMAGRTITLGRRTNFAHPAVDSQGETFTSEVLNLTRNVRIEGTPGGRAHVFIRSGRRQRVRFASIRHVGPSRVLGRYGLHFHHCHKGSKGSLAEGVVVRDAGHHAFVPHMSHGVTFSNCVSFDTESEAYWWDLLDATHGALYKSCVAALVRPGFEDDRGLRLSGFSINRGNRNTARGCVAVGVQGDKNASGFHWPEAGQGDGMGVWTFEDNMAHNCRNDGIFTWQNDESVHNIDRFVAYRCGSFGIEHGAYFNRYRYRDALLVQNAAGGVLNHARSGTSGRTVAFERVVIEDSPVGFLEGEINEAAEGNPPAIVCSPVFRNVAVEVDDGSHPSKTFNVQTSC